MDPATILALVMKVFEWVQECKEEQDIDELTLIKKLQRKRLLVNRKAGEAAHEAGARGRAFWKLKRQMALEFLTTPAEQIVDVLSKAGVAASSDNSALWEWCEEYAEGM